MNRRIRVSLFVLAAAGAAALFGWGLSGLPSFGHYPGPYGDQIVRRTPTQRHATNAVAATVLDFRGVDTAGEELILLAAAVGVLMLLRRMPKEVITVPHEQAERRRAAEPSNAVRNVTGALIAPATVLGLYLVIHGHLTPGGGFQGGVVLAVPSILLFLSARFRSWARLHHSPPWEIAQAIVVLGFILIGFIGLTAGAFLKDIMPLGSIGTVYSGGTYLLLNMLIGPGVATAIVLITIELIEQLEEIRSK